MGWGRRDDCTGDAGVPGGLAPGQVGGKDHEVNGSRETILFRSSVCGSSESGLPAAGAGRGSGSLEKAPMSEGLARGGGGYNGGCSG